MMLNMERSEYTVHRQVEAKRILYRDMVVEHTTWINWTGQYDITLTYFLFFLLSSIFLSDSLCLFYLLSCQRLDRYEQSLV